MSQTERLAYLDRRLRERGWVTTAEAAAHFEVTPRQIKRDIEYLRWRLDAPVIYDGRTRRYRYERPFSQLKFADERRVLFSALVRGWAASPVVGSLVTPEIQERIEADVSRDFRVVAERIVYRSPSAEPVDLELFSALCRGLREGRCVEIEYEDAEGLASRRLLEVERLIHYETTWYLLAWDHQRQALRTFHLGRVRTFRVTSELAQTRPAGWQAEVDRAVSSHYGMFLNGTDQSATVRLRGLARTRSQGQVWHPAQADVTGEDDEGPWLERSVPVADFRELTSRLLALGADAEPVDPDAFVQTWRHEIHRLSERLTRVTRPD